MRKDMKMRIAYMLHLNMSSDLGVFNKILRQEKAWRSLGHGTKLFVLTREEEVRKSFLGALPHNDVSVSSYSQGSLYSSFKNRIDALKELEEEILAWKPTVIYTREDYSYPPLIRLAKTYPLFIEFNGYILVQSWNQSKTKWLLQTMTRGFLLRSAAGFCYTAGGFAELRSYRKYKKPFIVIGNGIDLEQSDSKGIREYRRDNEVTRLVFIGTPGHFLHGIDKILLIAKANPDWEFEIIGYGTRDAQEEIPGNVILHGMMAKNEYEQIFMRADCALSSLSVHHFPLHEASALKTREYLKFGLPVIMAHKDTDFPDGAEFLLLLPNIDDNFSENISKIRNFVESWKGKRVALEKISHLDVNVKEVRRIEFFSSIIEPKS